MKFYAAPMEGITGYVFRNAHHQIFQGVEQYYTPFITPNQTRMLTSRELNDVLPEHNREIRVIPQILTNKAEDFLWAAGKLRELGYGEVNLNLGCPSATVVTKRRGSGFLEFPRELDRFLEEVCRGLEPMDMKLSVKTRIGKDDPEEFSSLLQIYNRYPLCELIVHPRIQTDFYKNHPRHEVFADAVRESASPVCYNGDIFTEQDHAALCQRFPGLQAVMLGRGLVANPALAEQLEAGTAGWEGCQEKRPRLDAFRLRRFHDAVLSGYRQAIPGDRNVMFKMKELWFYLGCSFANYEKYGKKIRKAQKLSEYEDVVKRLFEEQDIAPGSGFRC